ncbi:MAG: hypothetical protein ACFFDI_13700 [Promethearchaeota archaeon]
MSWYTRQLCPFLFSRVALMAALIRLFLVRKPLWSVPVVIVVPSFLAYSRRFSSLLSLMPSGCPNLRVNDPAILLGFPGRDPLKIPLSQVPENEID